MTSSEQQAGFPTFREWLRKGAGGVVAGWTGLGGSSKAYLLARWAETRPGPGLIAVASPERADGLVEDLRFFLGPRTEHLYLFPQWETMPYDDIPVHPEIVRERVKALYSLSRDAEALVVAPVRALMQRVLLPGKLGEALFPIAVGDEIDRDRLVDFLDRGGYGPVRIVEKRGEYSLRGAIVDIYSPLYDDPLRLEFDGDRLASIRRFETETQRSLNLLGEALLLPARDDGGEDPSGSLLDYLPEEAAVFVDEEEALARDGEAYSGEIRDHYEKALARRGSALPPEKIYLPFAEVRERLERRPRICLQEGPLAPAVCREVLPCRMESSEDLRREIRAALTAGRGRSDGSPFGVLLKRFRGWEERGLRRFIVSHTPAQAERLRELLSGYGVEARLEKRSVFAEAVKASRDGMTLLVGSLSAGFQNPEEGWVLLTEEEIFGERRRLREGRARSGSYVTSASELKEGDFVVHSDYGIGLYRGLSRLAFEAAAHDYLVLEYLDADKIYVPVDRLNLIQRYVGASGKVPKLDKLGTGAWQKAKRKAKAAVEEMVKELVDLYAARQAFNGFAFSSPDQFYREFEATFDYEETPDQTKAIEGVMRDMGQVRPMDRLVCGDVGYGKTEVAIRAAYRAVIDGKQVAVLVPTTVLAQQHLETFRNRFKTYPVVIEVMSRFRSPREQKEVLARVKEGKVDIVIGTHRLLQKDVVFRDLGLVVVDEEHRFGVLHKERLKQLKKLVDVITLTATPIPRTLQMGLSGFRDLSLIQTPPQNRLAIRTSVVRYDDDLIREAVRREFARGGQVFFVHNRVQNIYAVAAHLKELLPEASLGVAHGQMKEGELEKVMLRFVNREHNLLVCTSIIESGLDIQGANTILINHAERFGLADLYQLRGRVGRGSHQAYAYLLIPGDLVLSRDAMERLRAIQELSELGSGFKLALQDLEIRGAGNLLGPTQSGHIAAVGFEFYAQMMEKAVKEIRGEEVPDEITPEIDFPLPAFLPEGFVEDPSERLNLYRRLSSCRSEEEVEEIGTELEDRFGRLPEETRNLLDVIRVKILLTRLAIRKLEATPYQICLSFDEGTRVSPQKVVALMAGGEGKHRLTPDSRLIVEGWPAVRKDPFGAARQLLQALS
jgi:transcription-repair coupling factor (superfamily II helicase)